MQAMPGVAIAMSMNNLVSAPKKKNPSIAASCAKQCTRLCRGKQQIDLLS